MSSCFPDVAPGRLRALAPGAGSPGLVRVSTAAAITLGVLRQQMQRCGFTRCLNLLLAYPEEPGVECHGCGLAWSGDAAGCGATETEWPWLSLDALITRVATDPTLPFERICIAMGPHPRAAEDTLTVLRRWTEAVPAMPISVLANPAIMRPGDVETLAQAGAGIFAVALEAATPELFARHRGCGHGWEQYWETFGRARMVFGPGRIGMHLTVGMGETDRDILALCRDLHAIGGHSHLSCFSPPPGVRLHEHMVPSRRRWRRLQLARYLLEYQDHGFGALAFDAEGGLVRFGLDGITLERIVRSGVPFRTSGCPGATREDLSVCERPYGDGPPWDIASYPFALNGGDIRRVLRQLGALE
ncbi:Radical SAM protein [Rhodovastum atsumiense]|uniref:Radical SAM protein n=1 Tax=Rhodovastum atsumiense TaxID=504468 RepID=A0A5M6ITU0_9PROT|nr:radical SAM protein [Rhodovastum atsumiense]KAA5611726.1 radical SAM protein [Rhodovastum atsumiense]CAH2604304.1 Radical SAM protein [Rhodovastum atsumiense]